MRTPYEEIRNSGRRDIARVGGAVVTNLDGIRSKNRTLADVVKSVEFFAVSNNHCACCNFRSPTATGYPRVSGK